MRRELDTKTGTDLSADAPQGAATAITEGYRAPQLRSVGSAVKLIQGVGSGSYDQCGHSRYGC